MSGAKKKGSKRLSLSYIVSRNVRRRRFRTVVTVLALTTMIGTLFASQVFTQGVNYGLYINTERLGADLIVVPQGAYGQAQAFLLTGISEEFYMNQSVLQEVQAVPDVAQSSPQIFITSLSGVSCCESGDLTVIGIDPTTDFAILPWLVNPLPNGFGNGSGIGGAGMAGLLGSFPAVETEFFGQNFTVDGLLYPINYGMDNAFYVTISDARRIIELNQEGKLPNPLPISATTNEISDVIVRLKPGVSVASGAAQIMADVPGVSVVSTSSMTATVSGSLHGLMDRIYAGDGVIWAVSLLMVFAVFSISTEERKAETGLMRALGAPSGYVFKMLVAEGALQTAIGGVLGVCAGAAGMYLFGNYLTSSTLLTFVWPPISQIVLVGIGSFLVAVAIGILASFYPAYVTGKREPYAAITAE